MKKKFQTAVKSLFFSIIIVLNHAQAQELRGTVMSVHEFGANGLDTIDDTKAFQRCLDSVSNKGGGIVYVPEGTYFISNQRIPGKAICLNGRSNVSIIGEGKKSIIKLNADQPDFSRILSLINTINVKIASVTFDGNYSNQYNPEKPNEHLGGIFMSEAENIDIDSCFFENTGGDGIGLGGKVKPTVNVKITNCYFNNNKRNGLTLGSGYKNIYISNCYFGKDINNSPIDSEPSFGDCGNVIIENNFIETSNLFTVGGSSGNNLAYNILIRNNDMNRCAINIVYAKDVRIENNNFGNFAGRAAVTIVRKNENIALRNNVITMDSNVMFHIVYSAGMIPSRISIDSNTCNFNNTVKPCFFIKGTDSISITNNKIINPKNSAALVDVAATRDMTGFTFINNKAGYFGKNYNVRAIKNFTIKNVVIRDNVLANEQRKLDEKSMRKIIVNGIVQ